MTRWFNGLLALVPALAVAVSGWLGWQLGRAPLALALERQSRVTAQAQADASATYAKALRTAQERGDALTRSLAQRQQEISKLQKDKRDALDSLTTGRLCLDGPALQLLDSAPGLSVADLPAATGGAAATGAAAGAYSSDRDVARWAVDAGAAFEVCRSRLDALIDWNEQAVRP